MSRIIRSRLRSAGESFLPDVPLTLLLSKSTPVKVAQVFGRVEILQQVRAIERISWVEAYHIVFDALERSYDAEGTVSQTLLDV